MIGKVPKPGRGFRGLINYLLHGPKQNPTADKRVAWTELENLLIDDPDLAPSMMRATARKSRRVKSPVYHLVISWHKNEAPTEQITLYKAGLASRKELARSVRDRERAKEALDQTKSWRERLSGEVAQSLKPDKQRQTSSSKGPHKDPEPPKPQKKRRHTMGR